MPDSIAYDSVASGAGPRRILLVDDHPLVRAGLTAALHGESDLEVCGEAGTVLEALTLVRQSAPDVVILDLTLPDGGGLDLVKRMASLPAAPRILVCTVNEEALFAQRALAAGASGYIHKREAMAQVVAAIRRVLAGKIYLSADMTQVVLRYLAGERAPVGAEASIACLSDRELEVFALVGQCLSASLIAERLHLSVKTVETHRAKIKRKLHLSSGGELTRYAVQWVLDQH